MRLCAYSLIGFMEPCIDRTNQFDGREFLGADGRGKGSGRHVANILVWLVHVGILSMGEPERQ